MGIELTVMYACERIDRASAVISNVIFMKDKNRSRKILNIYTKKKRSDYNLKKIASVVWFVIGYKLNMYLYPNGLN